MAIYGSVDIGGMTALNDIQVHRETKTQQTLCQINNATSTSESNCYFLFEKFFGWVLWQLQEVETGERGINEDKG